MSCIAKFPRILMPKFVLLLVTFSGITTLCHGLLSFKEHLCGVLVRYLFTLSLPLQLYYSFTIQSKIEFIYCILFYFTRPPVILNTTVRCFNVYTTDGASLLILPTDNVSHVIFCTFSYSQILNVWYCHSLFVQHFLHTISCSRLP